MAAIVDEFPFPWHRREAQELHATLCQIYPTGRGAMFVAERAGLDPSKLYGDQAAYLLWKEILDAGAGAQRNRTVVTVAREQNPNNPRRSLLDALLAATASPIAVDHEPRGSDGAPAFISANDQVTEPEALLFHDDLTLAIGRVPWLISVLQCLQAVAPAVCRMRVSFSAGMQNGTAFRIAPNLLLTNWHVLHYADERGVTATAEFGYEDDGRGGGLASTAVQCDVTTVRGDAADDWAIVEPNGTMPDSIPTVRLSEAIEPADGALAFIVQHPGGERKRIAFVRNQVTAITDRVVHYLSDTQPGSSGSPVFYESGRLMALHHAGGRPQEVAGKTPLRKNEGIRISRIRYKMTELGVAVS
jgi:hypothetical protein